MSVSLIANWKMNGHLGLAKELLQACVEMDLAGVDLSLMLPFPYFSLAQQMLFNSKVSYGAQTVRAENCGAYTGDVSPLMLSEFGCSKVLLGHSERRLYWQENDLMAAYAAVEVLKHQITPVVCIGESLAVRQKNQHLAFVAEQVKVIADKVLLAGISGEFIFAYEPIWAIGTGLAATYEQVEEMHSCLREVLLQISLEFSNKCRIIYGGSVGDANLLDLIKQPNVDGALVGGASIDKEKFNKMVDICRL